tara:strand:+ start:770 stop:976 length:207 start_codon:yes stop_codon:yes gene_type:complete
MESLWAVDILGAKIPWDVEETSSIEEGSGVIVPIPTCAFDVKKKRFRQNKRKILFKNRDWGISMRYKF